MNTGYGNQDDSYRRAFVNRLSLGLLPWRGGSTFLNRLTTLYIYVYIYYMYWLILINFNWYLFIFYSFIVFCNLFNVCSQRSHKIIKTHVFPYFFPRKGTLTLTLGMVVGGGGGGGPFRTNNHKESQTILRTRISHTSGTFFQNIYKNTFKICSYIHKTTTNPINTLEITTYSTTKHQQHQNT